MESIQEKLESIEQLIKEIYLIVIENDNEGKSVEEDSTNLPVEELSMTEKTELNLYSQREGVNCPVYESYRSGNDEDHVPVWIGNVSFNGKMYETKTGFTYRTKKTADNAVAKIVLRSIYPGCL